MRLLHILTAAPLAAAFVVPNQDVFAQLDIEDTRKESWSLSKLYDSVKHDVKHAGHAIKDEADSFKHTADSFKHTAIKTLDAAFESAHDFEQSLEQEAFDAQGWAQSNFDHFMSATDDHHDHPPHDGPPHHGPPHDGPPHDGPPHHKRPHKKHGRHHHKTNETVYQLIAGSKYTTKLTELINDYPDLVEALNGTKANFTIFAPTNRAFEKIPEKAPKPSKEFLKKVLAYHVSPDFYPAGRVLGSHTIPTLLDGEELGYKPFPAQRVSVNLGLRGLTLNYYARVVAIDIFGSNGVIHGIDSILLPPPRTLKIISLLPNEFSTLSLALTNTGLLEELADNPIVGGTLFAPSNWAFRKLGPRINAFLFSPHGKKYLKALIKYHVVPTTTLYSDAVYVAEKGDDEEEVQRRAHYDLPTLLEGHDLSVDVARFGRFVSVRINGFTDVTLSDGVARDGVVHLLSNVLIPPRKALDGGEVAVQSDEEEMCLGEFQRRLEPFLE